MINMTMGFVGAGKLGTTLGKYLAENKCSVAGYCSRKYDDAAKAAQFTGSAPFESISQLVRHCGLVFLTVPDDALKEVWEAIRNININGKCFCHCSGALPAGVLDGAKERQAAAISLHPMAAVSSRWSSYRQMHRVSFTVEGDAAAAGAMKGMLSSLGHEVAVIPSGGKTLYHAGAVFLTNLAAALVHIGTGLMMDAGLERAFVEQAFRELFLANAQSICDKGLPAALTGPIERGDAQTIRKHLDSLEEPYKCVYRLLSRELLRLAKQKNPGRDYFETEKELTI